MFFRGGGAFVPRDAVGRGFPAVPGVMGTDGWAGGSCHFWGEDLGGFRVLGREGQVFWRGGGGRQCDLGLGSAGWGV